MVELLPETTDRARRLRAVPDLRPIVLTVAEVAELLGVCRDTAYNLIARGNLPATRVGSLLRVRRADVDAYLSRGRR